MLRRVRYRWIAGVLDQSLAEEARIGLGVIIRRPGGEAEQLPAGTPISAVFKRIGGGLLILGAPGSGKTTALLELARDLLGDATADETQPMPVVFHLSSWAPRRPPLAEWLVDELYSRYGVSRPIARQWLAAGEVLPLLDGLDEVAAAHRAGCVEAINAFHQEHGPVRFAVCSRTEEYAALAARLRVEEALELQPPTRGQVAVYLEAAGGALAGVQTALDADEPLWRFLQSPLVLSITALTFQDRPADALRAAGTPEQRLALLFTAYTERMFEHHPGRYAPARMAHWLAWLARSMREHDQTELHLDRLQPDWLPKNAQQRLVALIPAIGVGLFVGLCVGLFAGPGFGLLVGLIFGLLAGRTKEEPVEEVHWSWLRLRGNLAFVLVGGLCVGLLAGLVGGPLVGLVFGLVAGLGAGLVSGLFTRLADERPTPNEGIHRSARDALVFGLFVGLVLGPFVGLAFGLGVRLAGGLAGGPFVGLVAGLLFGLVSGLVIDGTACLQQLVLRGLLAWNGFAPVRYIRFLDEAVERLLLRRTGNGYLFVHRLLLEHFAGLDATLPPAAADPTVTLHRDPSS
ncbi:MAG: NACHT domain-containing protein [Stenotrophomonas sp.]|uniref:NACHT domain-containing protein n=1 Tax=Stenotrophomonas sp. TaxID=69392 RepID=UPI003D6D993D